ncbi:MAG: hypothetical protein GY757_41980 [bacterium]|nr:hypothetical protein [bacterium]
MEVNLSIDKKDIKYIKEFLEDKSSPVSIDDVAYHLALFKTQDNRSHKVKIYNPNCEYKIGDLLYKEYPGKIPVGAKKHIEIQHGVVLNVLDRRTRFGIDEVKLSYDGTSDFKKYLAYLDRQKIELLLPHKQQKPPEKPEFLTQDKDPRLQQAPMENRDFNALKKKLVSVFNKENDIAFISDKVLLNSFLKEIDDEVFDKIREFLTDSKKSETTQFFVENFVKVKVDEPDFDAYCFAVNYRMSRDFKIDFQQTRFDNWGKWNLISVIYYMKKNSPISETNPLLNNITFENRKSLQQRRKKFEDDVFDDGNSRFYLTQREVSAGALKLKPGFFDLGESIEIELTDSKTKKKHLLYYYGDSNIILGFKEVFEKYKALQGMIVSFEQTEDGTLQFTVRTTKKGTIADRIEYIEEEKAFKVHDEKIASPVFVNKAIFLEADIFKNVYEKIVEFREITSLNKLVHKVFLQFGIKEKNYEIHILRLYHILDLVYPIDLRLVEEVLLCNEEFIASEKLSGVFYLDSTALSEIEEEEYKRKETVQDESKKKREENRRKKIEEDDKLKEEVKRKREERRKKREEEMWQKEKLRQEREDKKVQEQKKREIRPKTERPKQAAPAPRLPEVDADKREAAALHARKKESVKKTPELTAAEAAERDAAAKKSKRKIDEDKSIKTPKRASKPVNEEVLSEDELKSQIKLEELKDTMRDQKKTGRKKSKKKKEIAYKDNGGFGGVFASKLDEVVKKDENK